MWARITRVYYGCSPEEAAAVGFDDHAFYEALAAPDLNRLVAMEHYDSQECRLLFQKWSNLESRVQY